MDLYAGITLLIGLFMVAMTIHVLAYSDFNKRQKGWFVATFITIAACALAEFAVHCGQYDQKFAIPLTILTILQFSVSPCTAMLFCGALGLKHQDKIAAGLFTVSFITEVICAPFGAIFKFDETGYHRGNLFILYEIFYFVSMAFLIVSLIFVGRKFKHRDRATIIAIVVVLAAGLLLMTFFGLHVAYSAIAISASLCYIYYNDLIQQDTHAELIQKEQRITAMQKHMITGLANLIENRDLETGEHVARTSELVKMIATDAANDSIYMDQIDEQFIENLYTLAPLHDVGKIVVSDRILRKPGKLTPEEYEKMKVHAAEGGRVVREILGGMTDPVYVQFAADIASCHHEKWDGSGYPKGLKGEEIPLSARIMAIADVFDAIVSKRCYKEAMPFEEAVKIIEESAGTHFDPKLTLVFLNHKEQYRRFCTNAKEETKE